MYLLTVGKDEPQNQLDHLIVGKNETSTRKKTDHEKNAVIVVKSITLSQRVPDQLMLRPDIQTKNALTVETYDHSEAVCCKRIGDEKNESKTTSRTVKFTRTKNIE